MDYAVVHISQRSGFAVLCCGFYAGRENDSDSSYAPSISTDCDACISVTADVCNN